jgi:hypothetical protein
MTMDMRGEGKGGLCQISSMMDGARIMEDEG